MQFQTEEINDILVVTTPKIDIDANNAEEFKKSVAPVVERHQKVVMDLGGIGFMDSAGLGAILSVYKKVRADGGKFVVYGLNGEVQALFDLVRMHRLFIIQDDKESALQAAQS